MLIRAFSNVHKKYSDALLVVVGSGPLEKQIHQLVSELGIAQKILFVGRVTHDQVPDYLAAGRSSYAYQAYVRVVRILCWKPCQQGHLYYLVE